MSEIKKRLITTMDSLPVLPYDLKTLLMDAAEAISNLEWKLGEAISLNLSFDAVLNDLKDAEFEREQYKSQVEEFNAWLADKSNQNGWAMNILSKLVKAIENNTDEEPSISQYHWELEEAKSFVKRIECKERLS